MFITIHIGDKKEFYHVGHLRPYSKGPSALVMYLGALLWITGCSLILVSLIIQLIFRTMVLGARRRIITRHRERATIHLDETRHISSAGDMETDVSDRSYDSSIQKGTQIFIYTTFSLGLMSYFAQWLFWSGFVYAADDRSVNPEVPLWLQDYLEC